MKKIKNLCSTLTGKWKILNKELKDNKGNIVFATFFKTDKWYALAGLGEGKQELYISELITKGGSPSNGGNMGIPKILDYSKNTRVLTWEYKGEDVDKFDIVAEHNPPNNWIAHADNPNRQFIVPTKYIKEDTQYFRVVAVKGNDKKFSEHFVVKHKEPDMPPPPDGDNAKLVAEAKDELKKVEAYILEHLAVAHDKLNKVK